MEHSDCINCRFVKECDKQPADDYEACIYYAVYELRRLIAQGEELKKQGFDCDTMLNLNRSLLADLETRI